MVNQPPLFDTNVLISALRNRTGTAATALLQADIPAISIITWMEVLTGASPGKEADTRRFLDRFEVIGLQTEVVERAVLVRRSMRLKLPDAIIYATALTAGRRLVTADRRDFPADTPGVSILDLTP